MRMGVIVAANVQEIRAKTVSIKNTKFESELLLRGSCQVGHRGLKVRRGKRGGRLGSE